MGGCASRPENCVGGRKGKKKFRKKRKAAKRRLSSRFSAQSLDKLDKLDPTLTNPTFHASASTDETWFDSAAILESDCSDEDFQSIPDDVLSLNGSEGASKLSIASLRDVNNGDVDVNTPSTSYTGQWQRPGETSAENPAQNFVGETFRNSVHLGVPDSRLRSDGTSNEVKPVFLDEISSVDESTGRGDGLLDNCGILPNNCLPCLASTVPSIEKRRSLSSSSPSTRKKAALKFSFKWKEGHSNATLLSSKMLIQRPIAGSQVPFCPVEKQMPDSWSQIDPSTFKVRGENYLSCAAYYPFGVDVFLSQRKIDHIARFVELPSISSYGELPPILVVNCQVCRRKILSVGGEYNMVRGVSGENGPFLCLSMWTCISCPMPDCPRYEVYRPNSKKDIQKFLNKDTKS